MEGLTARQKEIYEWIRDYVDGNGYPPTFREIGGAFGIRSPNGVMQHLRALESKGMIRRGKGLSRAIVLVEELPDGDTLYDEMRDEIDRLRAENEELRGRLGLLYGKSVI